MGGFDDHVAIIGDWMPPSLSPGSRFSSMSGDDGTSRSVLDPMAGGFQSGFSFPGSLDNRASTNSNQKNDGVSVCQTGSFSLLSEQRMSSATRGGLVERVAARGFNAPRLNTESIRPPVDLSPTVDGVRSPYLTIPPGLSPTTLLDSPVFLSNALVQSSPTTGKFGFLPNFSGQNPSLMEFSDKVKDSNFYENLNSASFAFKPIPNSGPPFQFNGSNKVTSTSLSQQSIPNIEVSVDSENTLPAQSMEPSENTLLNQQAELVGRVDHSPPLDELPDEDTDQRGGGDPNFIGGPAEDGYNWRKYGQKQVKGSEYPRSYYKCTHPSCPVKKKVERSQEGHITEIIYKGAHNHSKPPPNRRSGLGSSSNALGENIQLENGEQFGTGTDGDRPGWTTMRHDNLEVTSSGAVRREYGNGTTTSLQASQNGSQLESGDAVDGSSTFSNDEDDEDRVTHGSVSLGGYDGEGDESESKRRKVETYGSDMSGATRAIREPRVVVQTTSEVDILDDGYRWRKYGQKVVKGNPNPRSYYKCTSAGCNVRKHVERASHDLKSVITTYEGKHNHDVPAARNSSHANSGGMISSNNLPTQHAAVAVQNHVLSRPEPSHLHNSMVQFERPPLSSFALAGRPPLGPHPHGFGYGLNQPGLSNLTMAGVGGPGQGNLSVLPVNPYIVQQPQRPMSNDMTRLMFPKGELKAEPMSDSSGLNNLSNGSSSVYQQAMNRLPLGP
ncbi:OLC1v1022343C1 [Oldenlandia corymbosa var. corymbosa]|uniref:OLC1v1022343C1 n=1 Tax=Oldenlandia corymbosa var. corymbosa TaxID=529605 RepID=A0AAV1BZ92_OLDCO|nr:OLC1v1022343C1 [Oldenlandia corymbosa var. corymbosa]